MRVIEIAAGVAIGAVAWYVKRSSMVDNGKNYNGTARGKTPRGAVHIAAMEKLPVAQLLAGQDQGSRNVLAFLSMVRRLEVGTTGVAGYGILQGHTGKVPCTFTPGDDHPYAAYAGKRAEALKVARKNCAKAITAAAGAYQAMVAPDSWGETKRAMKLKDFRQSSQDAYAVGRLAARGALEYVVMGLPIKAIKYSTDEWRSLPGANESTTDMLTALALYDAAGGKR